MKYTNREIAEDLNLWNEYFNVDAMMTDNEFHAMTIDERLEMLNEAYPEDEMEKRIKEALEAAKEMYGEVDGIILTQEAYPIYHPESNKVWECDAVKIDGNTAYVGKVYWDFEGVENYEELADDASNLPWDTADEDDFQSYEEYDMTDCDEVESLLKRIG